MKKMEKKSVLRVACLLMVLCLGKYGAAQTSLTTYKLDFKTGKVEPSDLPFDVPFVISGTLDKNIREFELSYVELTEKQLLKVIQPDGKNCNCPVSCSSLKACLDSVKKEKPVCHKLCVQFAPGDNNTISFSAVVPPLKPNRYYVFLSGSKRSSPSADEVSELNKIVSAVYLNDLDGLYSKNSSPNQLLNKYTAGHIDSLGEKMEGELRRYYVRMGYTSVVFPSRGKLDVFADLPLIDPYLNHWEAIRSYQNSYQKSVRPSLVELRNMPSFHILLDHAATLDFTRTSIGLMQRVHLDSPDEDIFFAGLVDSNGKQLSSIQEQQLHSLSADEIIKITVSLQAARSQVQNLRLQVGGLSGDSTRRITVQDISNIKSRLDTLVEGMNAELGILRSMLEYRMEADRALKDILRRFMPTLNLGAATFGFVSAEFAVRAKWYIVPDIGVAYSRIPGDPGLFSYAGVNFNLWPVNRQHKFSLFDNSTYRCNGDLYKNISVVIGMTTKNIAVESTRISGVVNNNGLLIGGGIRLNDYIRLTSGGLLFRQQVNPLQAQKKIYASAFFALSIDIDVRSYLGELGSLLK